MKSEWKVSSNIINGSRIYSIYRLRDINETDHSGNREKLPIQVYDAFTDYLHYINERERPSMETALQGMVNLLNAIHYDTEAKKCLSRCLN